MTVVEIAGIVFLCAVIIVGIIIKRYTKRKLNDMDGVGGLFITTKKDAAHMVYSTRRP